MHKDHLVDIRDFLAVSAALDKSFAATSMKESVQLAVMRRQGNAVASSSAQGSNVSPLKLLPLQSTIHSQMAGSREWVSFYGWAPWPKAEEACKIA